jgi:hypothetical protein
MSPFTLVCLGVAKSSLIWRGYKEIKDAGGWVSLIFAGAGVYRTCKYRIGFEAIYPSDLRSSSGRSKSLQIPYTPNGDVYLLLSIMKHPGGTMVIPMTGL